MIRVGERPSLVVASDRPLDVSAALAVFVGNVLSSDASLKVTVSHHFDEEDQA